MTYKINGTELTMQPTTGRWLERDSLGIDGNGHTIYSPIRRFEIQWNLMSPAEVYQIQNFFDTVTVTGSFVVDLPEYNAATYTFHSYTGCVLSEPEVSDYFTENIKDVTLLISRIRT